MKKKHTIGALLILILISAIGVEEGEGILVLKGYLSLGSLLCTTFFAKVVGDSIHRVITEPPTEPALQVSYQQAKRTTPVIPFHVRQARSSYYK